MGKWAKCMPGLNQSDLSSILKTKFVYKSWPIHSLCKNETKYFQDFPLFKLNQLESTLVILIPFTALSSLLTSQSVIFQRFYNLY